jgi:hypothetical protein
MRISKTRVTNYRPDAGWNPPLERNARPGAVASPSRSDLYAGRDAKDAAEHDKAIDGLSWETLLAIARDLGARHAHDRRDHEHRWIMGRRAAVLRKLATLDHEN